MHGFAEHPAAPSVRQNDLQPKARAFARLDDERVAPMRDEDDPMRDARPRPERRLFDDHARERLDIVARASHRRRKRESEHDGDEQRARAVHRLACFAHSRMISAATEFVSKMTRGWLAFCVGWRRSGASSGFGFISNWAAL